QVVLDELDGEVLVGRGDIDVGGQHANERLAGLAVDGRHWRHAEVYAGRLEVGPGPGTVDHHRGLALVDRGIHHAIVDARGHDALVDQPPQHGGALLGTLVVHAGDGRIVAAGVVLLEGEAAIGHQHRHGE